MARGRRPRLEVRAGARVTLDIGFGELSLPALVMDPAGRIDLGVGRLSVAVGGITESAVRGLLLTGRNDGRWDGTAGFGSRAAMPAGGRAVGYLAGPEAISIAYAAAGDTNLDGSVDVADIGGFASNLGSADSSGAGWNGGDFNYDGIVDQLDISDFLGAGLFDQGVYLTATEAAFAAYGSD